MLTFNLNKLGFPGSDKGRKEFENHLPLLMPSLMAEFQEDIAGDPLDANASPSTQLSDSSIWGIKETT